MLDAHLAQRKYLVGDTLTVADFAVAAPMFYAQQAEMPLGPLPAFARLVRPYRGAAVLARHRGARCPPRRRKKSYD